MTKVDILDRNRATAHHVNVDSVRAGGGAVVDGVRVPAHAPAAVGQRPDAVDLAL